MSACCHNYPDCEHTGQKQSQSIEVAEKKPLSIDDYVIPAEKVDAILSFYKLLRKKHAHVKQERLIKKVAEYFHLQKKIVV